MNPLHHTLNRIKAQEASMTEDERNDRRPYSVNHEEGYLDALAGHPERGATQNYALGYRDGRKRREAMANAGESDASA